MTTAAIIKEIDKLPFPDKLLVIERTLQAIRREKTPNLKQAADSLYNDYKTDKELTIFTQIDSIPFL
jgi:hypothetical protein